MSRPQTVTDRSLRARVALRRFGLPIGLATASVVAYAPSLDGGFVWDDDVNVTTNTAMQSLAGLGRIWTDVTVTQQYYPVTHTSFWLQVQTTGFHPLAFHLVNVALHVLTALLLRAILRRLAVPASTFAAFLFALHPLNVESVAWITERKNVLAGALALGAVLLHLDADAAPRGRRRTALAVGAFALFLLALGAKTSASMFPIALIAVLVLVRGRRPRDLVSLAPWLVAGGIAGAVTAHLERMRAGAEGAEFAVEPAARIAIAGRAFVFYLAKLVWPTDLMFFYPRWTVDVTRASAWICPALVVALLAAALATYRVSRGPLTALLVYGALVFPALGFFNVYFTRYSFVQDHFAYFATMPVLALAAAVMARGAAWIARPLRVFGAACVLAILGALSFRGAEAFADYDTLFRVALAKNPDAWAASYNLGQRAHGAEAVALFESALHVRPNDPDVVGSTGTALAAIGRLDEALPLLDRATKLRPERPEEWLNLAAGLELGGRPADAATAYREAIARHTGGWARAERQLAWVLATTGDPTVRDGAAALDLATGACAKAKARLDVCEDTLAAAHAALGRWSEARLHEDLALQLLGDGAEGAHVADRRRYEAHAALYARQQALVVGDPL